MTGRIESINIAPTAAAPMVSVSQARAVPGRGLEGDRYFEGVGTYSDPTSPSREVTLIELEAIEAIEQEEGIVIVPGTARRNIVTSGIALNHFVDKEFKLGEVTLYGIRLCEPCNYLEELTEKKGIRRALVHRGGLRAEIRTEGTLRVGDEFVLTDTAISGPPKP